jgi:hypothetical protein
MSMTRRYVSPVPVDGRAVADAAVAPDAKSAAVRRLAIAGLALCLAVLIALPATVARGQATSASRSPGAARIWFYRDYDPYVDRNYATVLINGVVAGSVEPYGGIIARDVAPGRYHLTVDSVGTDVNQDAYVDLAPGQEAFVKILNLSSWDTGGLGGSYQRDTYYLRVMSPAVASAEMARRRS